MGLASGVFLGLICGGAVMTWWSAKRIERESGRQFEMGMAQALQAKQSARDRKVASADARRRRRQALGDGVPAARR
jgi:hypothetical protein